MLRSSSSSSSSAGDRGDIDAIIAEAADICALEQLAKLNTAHLSDNPSILPPDLEARFRKLKSLPASADNVRISPPPSPCSLRPQRYHVPRSLPRSETAPVRGPQVGNESEDSPPLVNLESSKRELKSRSRSDLGSSLSFSFDSLRETLSLSPSPSPPKQSCCFGWCAAGKMAQQGRKGKGEETNISEMRILELKKERRKLKKALKEQEELNKEAAKMLKWVKQASARMTVEASEEWPDDEDEYLK